MLLSRNITIITFVCIFKVPVCLNTWTRLMKLEEVSIRISIGCLNDLWLTFPGFLFYSVIIPIIVPENEAYVIIKYSKVSVIIGLSVLEIVTILWLQIGTERSKLYCIVSWSPMSVHSEFLFVIQVSHTQAWCVYLCIFSDYRYRNDELFKRMKVSTFVQLVRFFNACTLYINWRQFVWHYVNS